MNIYYSVNFRLWISILLWEYYSIKKLQYLISSNKDKCVLG